MFQVNRILTDKINGFYPLYHTNGHMQVKNNVITMLWFKSETTVHGKFLEA